MGTALAGKNGRISVNGTNIHANKYKLNFTADDLPTRTYESLGKDSGIPGFEGCEISIDGYWDADQNPHSSPPNFRVGQTITGNIYFYVNRTGNRRYRFTSVRVLAVPVQSEAEGLVTLSVTMKSNGDWSYPT
jgi:hypothetical protein